MKIQLVNFVFKEPCRLILFNKNMTFKCGWWLFCKIVHSTDLEESLENLPEFSKPNKTATTLFVK